MSQPIDQPLQPPAHHQPLPLSQAKLQLLEPVTVHKMEPSQIALMVNVEDSINVSVEEDSTLNVLQAQDSVHNLVPVTIKQMSSVHILNYTH
jgi:hypothetical protein